MPETKAEDKKNENFCEQIGGSMKQLVVRQTRAFTRSLQRQSMNAKQLRERHRANFENTRRRKSGLSMKHVPYAVGITMED
jgi:hypothetical protein